ncbi:hypothetical protein [Streptomyces canus]|uniref:hypothetical protein n=1 Tax=Streptomyces canus TaxID=58343 RepID=UPI00324B5309
MTELVKDEYDDAHRARLPLIVSYKGVSGTQDAARRALAAGTDVERRLPAVHGEALTADKPDAAHASAPRRSAGGRSSTRAPARSRGESGRARATAPFRERSPPWHTAEHGHRAGVPVRRNADQACRGYWHTSQFVADPPREIRVHRGAEILTIDDSRLFNFNSPANGLSLLGQTVNEYDMTSAHPGSKPPGPGASPTAVHIRGNALLHGNPTEHPGELPSTAASPGGISWRLRERTAKPATLGCFTIAADAAFDAASGEGRPSRNRRRRARTRNYPTFP